MILNIFASDARHYRDPWFSEKHKVQVTMEQHSCQGILSLWSPCLFCQPHIVISTSAVGCFNACYWTLQMSVELGFLVLMLTCQMYIIEFLMYLEFSLGSPMQMDICVWADVLTSLLHTCRQVIAGKRYEGSHGKLQFSVDKHPKVRCPLQHHLTSCSLKPQLVLLFYCLSLHFDKDPLCSPC